MSGAAPVVRIDAARCVGCARCIPACPFDAIAGLPQRGHVVLPELCTDCGRCLPACPVDCILPAADPAHPPRDRAYRLRAADRARRRRRRLERLEAARREQLAQAHAAFRNRAPAARAGRFRSG